MTLDEMRKQREKLGKEIATEEKRLKDLEIKEAVKYFQSLSSKTIEQISPAHSQRCQGGDGIDYDYNERSHGDEPFVVCTKCFLLYIKEYGYSLDRIPVMSLSITL